MGTIVIYRRKSCMAPSKFVARRGKIFRCNKGYYAFDIKDEKDFLDIPLIREAVDKFWLYRDGPYPIGESASEPPTIPPPVVVKTRKRKEVNDVPVVNPVDQEELQPGRPCDGTERDFGSGDRADYGNLPREESSESPDEFA